MEPVYVKRFIKSEADLPKDIILHVGNKKGFEELIYIEDGKTNKPWRYDDDDITALSINSIDWYMEPVEIPTKDDANDFAAKIDISGSEYRGFLKCYNWLLSRLK